MPVINKIEKSDHTKILVWQVTEPEEVLLERLSLSTEDVEKRQRLAPKRRKEFLGVRCALKSLGLSANVHYTARGKPFLERGGHISLSHAYESVAVAVSDHPIGVDIEKFRPNKILKVKKKFLRADEAAFINPRDEADQLHIIWGIKESLYKLHGGSLSSFLDHYKVASFSMSDERIRCWIIEGSNNRGFWAYHKRITDHHLIYVIDHG